ncbi:MAG: tRNA (N(6)-L-threonylcarbamoyladenosine(37)-C(2))-methylthiotransferase MtaB [Candidatus Magasanikbacteria bacterium]|nr:tRNA (N(6)-L-threonylcarbamoyladenosine(37)-C(2))-methylthiotransferase MtaB [Candidatus Magasanikbacteria bacterium]
MKLSIITLGCKLNQAESDEIKNALKKLGHFFVPISSHADVAIIRACAVTMNASQTTRGLIRQAKKRGAYVIAGGCLENRDLPEIDYVAQTAGDIIKQIYVIARSETTKQSHVNSVNQGIASLSSEARNDKIVADRTRGLIKIQGGCNFNCTYCVIPHYRGKSKSVPAKEVIRKIIEAENRGINEITLTGVNICQYRAGITNLTSLLKNILKNTSIKRIRLGSLDPRLITAELIGVFKNPRLMPHWHLSLQSGSDSILKRMNRGYTTGHYLKIVNKLRKQYPLFSFTTDIIVGFPGETDKEFDETMAYVKVIGFSKVHVFPYSKRPNTPAGAMTQVHDKTKTERVKRLIKLSGVVARKYASKLKGKIRPVLFEQKKNGYWIGYSPEYILAKYRSNANLKNQINEIKIIPA